MRQAQFRAKIYSLRVFSVYVQVHSPYSQYMHRFIPSIFSIHTDSFCVLGECIQITLNIQKGIIFFTAFKGKLFQKTLCMCASGPKTHKK